MVFYNESYQYHIYYWGLIRFQTILDLSFILVGFPGSSAGKESTCNAGDPGSIPGLGRSAEEGIGYPLQYSWAPLVAETVKNLPARCWEDPLEKGTGYPLQYFGLENSRHDWATFTSYYLFTHCCATQTVTGQRASASQDKIQTRTSTTSIPHKERYSYTYLSFFSFRQKSLQELDPQWIFNEWKICKSFLIF